MWCGFWQSSDNGNKVHQALDELVSTEPSKDRDPTAQTSADGTKDSVATEGKDAAANALSPKVA